MGNNRELNELQVLGPLSHFYEVFGDYVNLGALIEDIIGSDGSLSWRLNLK